MAFVHRSLFVQLSCYIFQCVPLEHGGFKEPLVPICVVCSMPCPALVGFQEVLQGYLQGHCQVELPAVAEWSSKRSCFSYPFFSSHRIVLPLTPFICGAVFFQHLCKLCFSIPPCPSFCSALFFFPQCEGSQALCWSREQCGALLCVFQEGKLPVCYLVGKQASRVILGISRDFSVSGHWEQKLELQLIAFKRSCNSFPAADGWLLSVQNMWDLPLWSPALCC